MLEIFKHCLLKMKIFYNHRKKSVGEVLRNSLMQKEKCLYWSGPLRNKMHL